MIPGFLSRLARATTSVGGIISGQPSQERRRSEPAIVHGTVSQQDWSRTPLHESTLDAPKAEHPFNLSDPVQPSREPANDSGLLNELDTALDKIQPATEPPTSESHRTHESTLSSAPDRIPPTASDHEEEIKGLGLALQGVQDKSSLQLNQTTSNSSLPDAKQRSDNGELINPTTEMGAISPLNIHDPTASNVSTASPEELVDAPNSQDTANQDPIVPPKQIRKVASAVSFALSHRRSAGSSASSFRQPFVNDSPTQTSPLRRRSSFMAQQGMVDDDAYSDSSSSSEQIFDNPPAIAFIDQETDLRVRMTVGEVKAIFMDWKRLKRKAEEASDIDDLANAQHYHLDDRIVVIPNNRPYLLAGDTGAPLSPCNRQDCAAVRISLEQYLLQRHAQPNPMNVIALSILHLVWLDRFGNHIQETTGSRPKRQQLIEMLYSEIFPSTLYPTPPINLTAFLEHFNILIRTRNHHAHEALGSEIAKAVICLASQSDFDSSEDEVSPLNAYIRKPCDSAEFITHRQITIKAFAEVLGETPDPEEYLTKVKLGEIHDKRFAEMVQPGDMQTTLNRFYEIHVNSNPPTPQLFTSDLP